MRFFKDVILQLRKSEIDVISKDAFIKIFNSIDIEDNSFTNQTYLPGTKGQTILYKELIEKVKFSND